MLLELCLTSGNLPCMVQGCVSLLPVLKDGKGILESCNFFISFGNALGIGFFTLDAHLFQFLQCSGGFLKKILSVFECLLLIQKIGLCICHFTLCFLDSVLLLVNVGVCVLLKHLKGLLGIRLVVFGLLVLTLKIGQDHLQDADNTLGLSLCTAVLVIEDLWGKITYSVSITVRVWWNILACLHESISIKILEEIQGHLDGISTLISNCNDLL